MFATFRFQRFLSRYRKHRGLNELVETIISFQVTLLKLKSTSRNYKHFQVSVRGSPIHSRNSRQHFFGLKVEGLGRLNQVRRY